jgi:hypothetical protein
VNFKLSLVSIVFAVVLGFNARVAMVVLEAKTGKFAMCVVGGKQYEIVAVVYYIHALVKGKVYRS